MRPTSAARTPEQLAGKIDADQHKLYTLIWRRAVASQMEAAVFDTVAVDLAAGTGNAFRANGSTLLSPGFLAVYRESFDDATLEPGRRREPLTAAARSRRPREAARHRHRAAFHRAAAALLGGEPRQGARGVRHRPAFDLREHHPDAALQEVLRAGEQALHPDRPRQDRQPVPDRQLRALRRLRLHGRDGGRARQHLARRGRLAAGARALLGRAQEADRRRRPERHALGRRDGARARHRSRSRAARSACATAATARSRRSARATTRRSRSSRACGPASTWTTVTLADALELFQLPRTLGNWEDGYPIKVAVGRFGPYVQYGAKKYASLKKEDDPYTVTLERALEIIREKREIEANRIIREFPEAGIQVLNGRYGPYITDGKKNGKIPKDRDPKSLTLEECQALLAAAPGKPDAGAARRRRRPAAAPAESAADAARQGQNAPRRRRLRRRRRPRQAKGGEEGESSPASKSRQVEARSSSDWPRRCPRRLSTNPGTAP